MPIAEKETGADFRLMTCNVWGNCGQHVIANRDDLLAGVFLQYMPDVLGLQEVSRKSRAEPVNIIDLLGEYYVEVDVPLDGSANNFTPLLVRKELYTIVDRGFHRYSGLNDSDSKSITWAVLECRRTGKRAAVCNTHYYWTSDEAGKAARLNNSKELLDIVQRITADYGTPVFCIGDFNCTAASDPARLLFDNGLRDAQSSASVRTSDEHSHHPYPQWDAETATFKNGPAPTGGYSRAIDHIYWMGDQASILVYETITSQDALDGSDHCPIYVDAAL